MSRLFQIHEDDLAELERLLPDIFEALTMREDATARERTQSRRVQEILSRVRWNYGPPEEVSEVQP